MNDKIQKFKDQLKKQIVSNENYRDTDEYLLSLIESSYENALIHGMITDDIGYVEFTVILLLGVHYRNFTPWGSL